MGKNWVVFRAFSLFAALLPTAALAAIYGTDDRMPVTLAPAAIRTMAPALGLFISKENIVERADSFDLKTTSFRETMSLCPEVRGGNLPSFFIGCTGFLVADDLLVTAGHCMVNFGEVRDRVTPQCETFSWVADFQETLQANGTTALPATTNLAKSRLWECEKVIYATLTETTDYALVKLKRKTGRTPLRLASASPRISDPLSLLGYPFATPLTYAANAQILSREPGYYRANLDAFPGNSGSPVFNASNEVLGLLVRGFPESLNWNEPRQCNLINHCDTGANHCEQNPENDRIGEHIQPIEPLQALLRGLGTR